MLQFFYVMLNMYTSDKTIQVNLCLRDFEITIILGLYHILEMFYA